MSASVRGSFLLSFMNPRQPNSLAYLLCGKDLVLLRVRDDVCNRTRSLMDAGSASRIGNGDLRQTTGAALEKRICDFEFTE